MNTFHDLFDGVDVQTKVCGICQIKKPLGNFGNDGGANYKRYECKECAGKQHKIVAKIKKSVAPPPADYQCPICKRTAEQAQGHSIKKKQVWCADHNHETEQFRGWLCHKCNLGLGNFADNIERLESAKQYMEKHELRH